MLLLIITLQYTQIYMNLSPVSSIAQQETRHGPEMKDKTGLISEGAEVTDQIGSDRAGTGSDRSDRK